MLKRIEKNKIEKTNPDKNKNTNKNLKFNILL